jgi:hypothetical protein
MGNSQAVQRDAQGRYILNQSQFATCNIPQTGTMPIFPNISTARPIRTDPSTSGHVYFTDVDEGVLYIGKLLSDEKAYFTSKYGEDVYNELTATRQTFLKNDVVDPDSNFDNKYSQILENIHILNNNSNMENIKHYLNTYLPSYDANPIYKHIEYTNEEFIFLQKVNFYINIAYYICFIILILLLISSNNLYLRERFVLYIFLAILPVLYPWFYILFRNIWRRIFPVVDYGGPKQIDTTTNTITMYSNNVKK